MLYQTLPLCCPFNLSSTTLSSTLPLSFSSSVSVTASSCPLPPPCSCCCPSSSQVQAKAEMDCIEAKALKGSFTEVAFMKSSQQAIHEYPWVANGPSTVVSGDDLFVDEFLDFPNDDVEEVICQEEEEEEEEEGDKPCSSVSFQAEQPLHENSNSTSNSAIFSIPELSVPADDLADLEWLSHFVEDSFLEFSSVPYSSTSNPKEENQNLTEQGTERVSVKQPSFCFPTPVPCKARSKRSRAEGRTWPIGSLSFTESSSTYSSSSTSSTTTTSSSSSPMSLLTSPENGNNMDMVYYLEKPAVKKPKKEKRKLVGEGSGNRQQQQQPPQAPRRCSHCHVQKTPQWRAGPLGAKTLCNACGVRYKSGRLLPEYRPACSPTFSGDIHSNSHRKVLEMRRKKESGFTGIELSSWVPAVQSW